MFDWYAIQAIAAIAGGSIIFAFSGQLRNFHKFMGFTLIFEGLVLMLAGIIYSRSSSFYLPIYALYIITLLAAPFCYYFATHYLLNERPVQKKEFWMMEVIPVSTAILLAFSSVIPGPDKDTFINIMSIQQGTPSTGASILMAFDTAVFIFFIVEQLCIQIYCIIHLFRYRKLLENYYSSLSERSFYPALIISILMALRFICFIIIGFSSQVAVSGWFLTAMLAISVFFYAVITWSVCHVDHTAEEIGQLINSREEKSQAPSANDIIKARLDKMIDDKFYLDPEVNLLEIADKIQVNSKYVADYLKFHYGETFLSFTNRLRVEYSTRFLDKKSIAVIDIAEQCGFSNISTYYRNFTKVKGISPSTYREQASKSEQ